ncbi:hypothetical protein ACH5RR_010127 [Cinchona calisaya]|uniref:Uncharacterized protein n=1 Tax=Cinchona calisaya TaxID=153742 RepID=A0ABD3AID5_9GENT
MLLFKYKGHVKFDVCFFDPFGIEAAYPRSGFALVDDNVMPMDEGFTRDRSENTIIISSSSDDVVGGAMVEQSKKSGARLRNVLWAGSSRAFALNKLRVKSLHSSNLGTYHLQYDQRVFDSTVPFFCCFNAFPWVSTQSHSLCTS